MLMCQSRAAKRFALLLLTIALALPQTRGQDADTVLMKGAQPRLTVLSQIEDPREAQAFLTAYRATEPAKRLEAAQAFIESFPNSWLLAEAADLSAKASIDLGHYDDAIKQARFSLRLLPENSTLLVLLANAEARNRLTEQAISDASDALSYLEE